MLAGQLVEGLEILGLSSLDHIGREAWRRRLLIPVNVLEVIPNKLLIKRGLSPTRPPRRRIPEAGGIRCQYLVGKNDVVADSSKFEFRVCKYQATRFGVRCSLRINRQCQSSQLGRISRPNARFNIRVRDILVVGPILALGGRGKQWL